MLHSEGRPQPEGLWRHHDFMALWTGQTISLCGSMVGGFALDMTAIIVLRATPAQIMVLSVAGLLPGLLAGLVVGVWVDRLRRRPLMIAADLGRAALLLSIPLAASRGVLRIEQLYVVAVGTGLLGLCFETAYRSYLPALVAPEALLEGNSKLGASSAAAEAGGSSAAGLLVQALSAPTAILIDAVSFVLSAASLALIRTPEPARPVPAAPRVARGRAGAAVWAEVGEGLQLVGGEPILRALAAAQGMFALFQNILGVVIMLYFIRALHLAPALLGPLFALGGLSALAGAAVAQRVVQGWGMGRVLLGALILDGATMLFIPLAGGPLWLVLGLLAAEQLLGDGAGAVFEIAALTLRQSTTPQGLQGRVGATLRVVEWAARLAGLLLGGLLGQTIGLRATLFVGALGALLLAPPWLLAGSLRGLRGYSARPPSGGVPSGER